jgi:Alpha/beta hydrolase family
LKSILLALTLSACAFSQTTASATTVRFSTDPGDGSNSAYSIGPFPSNALSVTDKTQATGVRINLPSSNDGCMATSAAVCSYSSLLNQLDGFSVNPRLMVCFSNSVDLPTLPAGITVLASPSKGVAQPIQIDRVLFDPASNCAYAKPAHVLQQQKQYLLIVTNAIQSGGQPIQADPQFKTCSAGTGGSYCQALSSALVTAKPSGTVVAASLFTTMSVTPWLQGAETVAAGLLPLNLPAGLPSYFTLNQIQKLTYYPDDSGVPSQDIPISALKGVNALSFGLFLSPSYLNTQGDSAGTITVSPKNPTGFVPVSYHVFLPASPQKKIPVVIYVHGSGDTQFGAPTFIAATLAKNGFATLAFEITGHGYGLGSTVAVKLRSGLTDYEFTPGRGVQLAQDQPISSESGCVIPGPVGVRDCVRQSAVDVFSLVHLIKGTGGLGLNLDPNRIYIVGQSLGSLIASTALPIEPLLRDAVLNGDGGTSVDIARLSPSARQLAEAFLASIPNPALFNVGDGAPPDPIFNDGFNDNYVFSALPPKNNSIPYAPNIQAAFEAADWLGMLADPLAFGPYLSTAPLPGNSAKHALFQFGIGDLEVPNPTETAAVNAADAQKSTWILNFPAAIAVDGSLATLDDPAIPGFPILPHRILSNPTIFSGNAAELSLAMAEQQQLADFVASDGKKISDPNQYLTTPFTSSQGIFVTGPLPTGLNYLPPPGP